MLAIIYKNIYKNILRTSSSFYRSLVFWECWLVSKTFLRKMLYKDYNVNQTCLNLSPRKTVMTIMDLIVLPSCFNNGRILAL